RGRCDGVVDRLHVAQHVVGIARLLHGTEADCSRRDSRRCESKLRSVSAHGADDRGDRVRVSVPAAQSVARRAALDVVELDLEHEPPGAVTSEEVLDRLRPLAARSRGPHAGPERDQRCREVAALGVRRRRRADVAAQCGVATHLCIGDVARRLGEDLDGVVDERGHGRHRADDEPPALGSNGVEAGLVEHQRALRSQLAGRDVAQDDGPAGDDRQALAAAVQGNRLVGGGRDEHLICHGTRFYGRTNVGCGCDSQYPAEVAFTSIDELEHALSVASYLTDRGLATALYLALTLEKPLLLEGEAGVGKTEAAKAMAVALDAPLIRLQCYEGLDIAHAVYEWNYARQLLHIRAAQEGTVDEAELFGRDFLIRRPVLEALESERRALLLIDEIDRADEEFEAFLLEVLSDFQVTIPELGTIHARQRPYVILTSNRTRELHDALKRRCLYHWIGHPS